MCWKLRSTNEGRVYLRAGLLVAVAVLSGSLVQGCSSAGEQQVLSQSVSRLTADPAVVISQVYGGGSNTGAPWQNDFVELFNRSGSAVALDGWSIQYASATGTGLFSSNVTPLSGAIQPGQYFLVAMAGGTTNGSPLPTPDVAGNTAMSASSGKVVLVDQAQGLACNGGSTPCDTGAESHVIDLVGYGSANYFETAAAPTLSNTTAALRAASGCTDTNSNAADFTAATPTPRNTSSPLSPCGADTAPLVASTSPAANATDVAPGVVVTVSFSEPVNLDAGAFSFACSSSGSAVFSTSGGPTVFSLTPAAQLALGESCTVTVYGAAVHDQDSIDPPDTMAADFTLTFSVFSGPGVYRIHDIQGRSHLSPLVGQTVSLVPGIVTVVRNSGFYLQDPLPDDDEATSEGIYVYTGAAPAVLPGDEILISGPISEYRPSCSSCGPSSSAYANLTTTEIDHPTSIAVLSSGNPLPPPVTIGFGAGERRPPTEMIDDGAGGSVESAEAVFDPATQGIDFYESLEAMRVKLADAVAVGPTAVFSDSSRELVVLPNGGIGATGRTPRGGILATATDFNPERMVLSSILGNAIPDANVGDRFPGATIGVVDYSYGNFKLLVTEPLPVLQSSGLAREVLSFGEPNPAQLSAATLNCENLDPNDGPDKFSSLASIVVESLKAPDLLALEEVQDNNGATNDEVVDASQTLGMLIDAIAAAGGPLYQYRQIDPQDDQDGGESGGNIRVVFLFRADRGLAFVDRPGAVYDTPNQVLDQGGVPSLRFSPGRLDPTNTAFAASRKPLAGEFLFNGRSLFVIANHFNSKGGDHPLMGRFQPPVLSSETQRLAQAQVVASFVKQIRAIDSNSAVVVLGDLNDFEFSAPVAILEAEGLTPLIKTLPPEQRYTYVYEGNSQALDHILVSPPLLDSASFDVVHLNSEFRIQTSDHDPSLVRFALGVPVAFSSSPVTNAVQGQTYRYDAEATGQPVPTYFLDAAPAGMSIDPISGVIDWTPLVLPGSYSVTVRATNGLGAGAVQQFGVVVAPANDLQRLTPVLECVEWSKKGTFTARFGYRNPNAFPVQIPVGLDNWLLPGAADRGQPTVFQPGSTSQAFQVPLSFPVLAWVLDGRIAIASVSPFQRCR